MKKIIDFLKENKFGAIIGGIYFLIALSNIDYLKIITGPAFIVLALISLVLPIQSPIIFIVIALILGVSAGAIISKLIKVKKFKVITFITTLVFLAMAFMFFFGLLIHPDRPLPDRCIFSSGFHCLDFLVSKDGVFAFKLENSNSETIFVNSVGIKIHKNGTKVECSDSPVFPIKIESGRAIELIFKNCRQIMEFKDNRERFLIDMTYTVESFPDVKVANGDLFTTIVKNFD